MSATPEDVAQVPPKSEEAGTPPPEPKADAGTDWQKKATELETEVKQLRETRKTEAAKRIASQWPEDKRESVENLLLSDKSASIEDMEGKAKVMREIAGTPPPEAPKADEPENKDQLAKAAAAGDAGAPPPEIPDRGLSEDAKALKGLTIEQMAAKQAEAKAKLRPPE